MIIIQKFGGTSLAKVEDIKRISLLIKKEIDLGNQVVVIVSAMGNFTDILADYAKVFFINTYEARAEKDVILSVGEQITSGLLALSLMSIGVNSRSWLSWQIPICTTFTHTKAKIIKIKKENIENCLSNNIVPVITGFQGIDEENQRITTIGRGGSDISAVEIAISLNADRCDIYTDVDGIYTADPNLVTNATKLPIVTYDEMLEMAAMGAKVLHANAVERAMQYKIKLQVLSSFNNEPGTLLVRKDDNMKNNSVTAVTCNNDEACIIVHSVESPSHIFSPLAAANINVNIIVQNLNSTDITFTVAKNEMKNALQILKKYKVTANEKVSIISIVGIGMLTNAGVACKMFEELEENNIKILVVTTSEIKISAVLQEEYRELAVGLLHTAYGLDKEE